MGQGTVDETTLAGVIETRVKASGISVAEILRATGMTRSTWYRRLSAEQPFTAPELYAIAGVLGTTMSALAAEAEHAA